MAFVPASPTSASSNNNSNVWAPELDTNGLEQQLDKYADETVKAAAKVQSLPISELTILQAAAASNRSGNHISPARRDPSSPAGTASLQAMLNNNESNLSGAAGAGAVGGVGGGTKWRSLQSLPPYILRLMFAAGQMCTWLLRGPAAFAVGREGNGEQLARQVQRQPRQQHHQPVSGHFAHLVLPVHEAEPLDTERVVEYLTEFSEFPQIAEIDVVLHDALFEASGVHASPGARRSINSLPHMRAVLPATEGELSALSPTQRAQFAADVKACHRSSVVYAVRQWCFAIGRYLLLLDQRIKLLQRELRIQSQQRVRKQLATLDISNINNNNNNNNNNTSATGGIISNPSPAGIDLVAREEEEMAKQLERTHSDMADTFRSKFMERGGMEVLGAATAGSGRDGAPQLSSRGEVRLPGGSSGAAAAASEATAAPSSSRQQQQQQSSSEQRQDLAPPPPPPHRPETRQEMREQQQQQQQQRQSSSARAASVPSTANGDNASNNIINKQQQQQNNNRSNTVSPPRNPTVNSSDVITNNTALGAPVTIYQHQQFHTVPTSSSSSTSIPDGRASSLLESLRLDLVQERSRRQQAEQHCTQLRLEAARFEARLGDATLQERQQAEREANSLRTRLQELQSERDASAGTRASVEASRDEMANSLRAAMRSVETAEQETRDKVNQLLQAEARVQAKERELRDLRLQVDRSDKRAEQAVREAENSKLQMLASSSSVSVSNSQQVTPAREMSTTTMMMRDGGQPIRTIDGSMVFASPAVAGAGSIRGVYQGQAAGSALLHELQSMAALRRVELEKAELECRLSLMGLARAAVTEMHSLSQRGLSRATASLEAAQRQLNEQQLQQQQKSATPATSSSSYSSSSPENNRNLDELKRLRDENYSLQKTVQDTTFELQQMRNARKAAAAAAGGSNPAAASHLEAELQYASQRAMSLEEQLSSLRFAAAQEQQALTEKFHDEQQARIRCEVALRQQTERATETLAALQAAEKRLLETKHTVDDERSRAERASERADAATHTMQKRVADLEQERERHLRELEDLRRQNRGVQDEMAAVRRHNATLDTQLANMLQQQHQNSFAGTSMMGSSSAAHTMLLLNEQQRSQTNNVFIDALKTKIETLEAKEREATAQHQAAAAQYEQRIAKIRSDMAAQSEHGEAAVFDLKRANQQLALKAEGAEAALKDLQRRGEDTVREAEQLRAANRELQGKLHERADLQREHDALRDKMRYVEDDAERRREEIINLRAARTEATEKLAVVSKERDAARVDLQRQLHTAEQQLQETERSQRRKFGEDLEESARRQRARHEDELSELKLRLEEARRVERVLQEGKAGTELELRKAREQSAHLEGQLRAAQQTVDDLRELINMLKKKDKELDEMAAAAAAVEKKKKKEEEEKRQQQQQLLLEDQQQRRVPQPPISSPPKQQQQQQQQKPPETLNSIAARTGVPIQELLAANPTIAHAAQPLAKGTRVILPPVRNDDQKSAETSTNDLSAITKPAAVAAAATVPWMPDTARPSLDSVIMANASKAASRISSARDEGTGATWNSLVDLIVRIGLVPPPTPLPGSSNAASNMTTTAAAEEERNNRIIDSKLMLELNEKVVLSLDTPLPPGANVILPVRYDFVPSLAAIRSRLDLLADGAVRLRDQPEPSDPTKPLAPGSVVTVTRSLQCPSGATIRQLAQRLSMDPLQMLEANPSLTSVDEIVPWYRTVFVPRREDPDDMLSVSWRRTRAASAKVSSPPPDVSGLQPIARGPDSNNDFDLLAGGGADGINKRPPWTLEETAKRCGVTFDELMRVNTASFPGTCRIHEDLLPHFIPFKFILRPFRAKVQPTRLLDLSRMLHIPAEDLLKVNSGVSSGTALLYPGQSIKVPVDGNYLRVQGGTDEPMTVAQVAQQLHMSPVEFLKDNHRQYLNLSERVTGEFFVVVRDVDEPNFGDFTMQLGVVDPVGRKEEKKKAHETKFLDRLRDAMDFGPRNSNDFEDEEDLEQEAASALRKKRRNSNDYWMQQQQQQQRLAEGNNNADDNNNNNNDNDTSNESGRRSAAHKASTWETGWVSRVSVREQKVVEGMQRLAELEEAERTSEARVRHLPLLSSSSANRRSHSAASSAGGGGEAADYNSSSNHNSSSSAAAAAGVVGAAHNVGHSPSRPTSAAILRLSQQTPPPLASLDLPPRPSSAAALRSQVASQRGSALPALMPDSFIDLHQQIGKSSSNNNNKNMNASSSSLKISIPGMPDEPCRAPRKPELPEELAKYLSRDVTPTVKENTLEFFDFNPWKRMLNDDLFRHVVELLARKQCQSLVSVYFAGMSGVSPDVALKGVALLAAHGTRFKEFTTDAMQFPPGAMAQLRLLLARKDELRATKWIFESCVASQRTVMHLRGKKLTDASAVLLDALDEMHTGQHKLNIIDMRDNFLTNDTGRVHLKNILERDWSPVTQLLLDGNPDFDEASRREISELAEKKDKKLLLWAQFQQQVSNAQDRHRSGRALSPTLDEPMSASRISHQRSMVAAAADIGVLEERSLSPTQRRFMKRFQ